MNCLICDKALGDSDRPITSVGLATLVTASGDRRDGKGPSFQSAEKLILHEKCRKDYTRPNTLARIRTAFAAEDAIKAATEGAQPPALRSQVQSKINFKQNCFVCGEECSHELEVRKRVAERKTIHMCSTLPQINVLRKIALDRKDELGDSVYCRLANAIDTVQADAQYHHECYLNFKRLPAENPVGRPADVERRHAFLKVCQELEENDECQYSIAELCDLMQTFLKDDELCYSRKYFKKVLAEHFKERLVFANTPGLSGIVCFRESADKLIHDTWYASRKQDAETEKVRFVEATASILSEAIKSMPYDLDSLEPNGNDISDRDRVPPLLQLFVDRLAALKNDSKIAARRRQALCDIIITACRPRSFISPLLLAVGVYMHRHYESRILIDIMNSIGFSVSYAEVKKFEESLMVAPELEQQLSDTVIQLVFDNADINVKSLDGHGTFHCMGGLMIFTPRLVSGNMPIRIKRLKSSCRSEKVQLPEGWLQVIPYEKPSRRGFSEVTVRDVTAVKYKLQSSEAYRAYCADTLWMCSFLIDEKPRPNWSGFMERALHGFARHEICGKKVLPFINRDPNDPTCINSALQYAANESERLGQLFCFVTFDLPLFMKAMDIVLSDGSTGKLGSKVVPKLGPFHFMMSYMGATSHIMLGSGLEEAWATVYAKGSIKKMMSGHAYARAIRAHFLTQLALCIILLRDSQTLLSEEARHRLNDMHQRLANNDISLDEASQTHFAQLLVSDLDSLCETKSSEGRTGAYWVQYIECVELLRLFLKAERTSDWPLHIFCVKQMLPIFSAAAHLPYAKGGLLYSQHMEDLFNRFDATEVEKIIKGSAIRRTEKSTCVSADLAIEQDVMRTMKVSGGLVRGRGVTDNSLSKWIWAMPRCAPMCNALEEFSGVRMEGSEQHVELRESRQSRDWRDLNEIIKWFEAHPPFAPRPAQDLVSLSSGLVADESVNCDRAFEVGLSSLGKLTGKSFADLKMKRSDRVKTLASMANSVTMNKKNVEIHPEQFFHRIIFICDTEEEKRRAFEFELAPQPAALFEKGLMRKTTKSSLAEIFVDRCPLENECPQNAKYVVDGGFLLHSLSHWKKGITFSELSSQYVSLVQKKYGTSCHVVFDGYRGPPSPKGQEQLRRGAIKGSVRVEVKRDLPLTVGSSEFLSNSENKAQFIDILRADLKAAKITANQAQGDADTLIVEVALQLSSPRIPVVIVANDTDIIVISIARLVQSKHRLFIFSPGTATKPAKVFNINKLVKALGKDVVDVILVLHAISGCDTNCAIFKKAKKAPLAILESVASLRKTMSVVFYNPRSSKESVAEAGEAFFMKLYELKGIKGNVKDLNTLRFLHYTWAVTQKRLSSTLNLASLPPTKDAVQQHSFRTYWQVQQWLGNAVEPTNWGWRKDHLGLSPIPMEQLAAPDALMQIIACKCTGECGARCSCRKKNLLCSIMCKYCLGVECLNRNHEEAEEDPHEDVDDPDRLP